MKPVCSYVNAYTCHHHVLSLTMSSSHNCIHPLDEIPASQAGAVFLAGGLGILTVSALFVGELDINTTDADFPLP